MKESGQHFTVHGEPSDDEYGCSFSYTNPAVATVPQRISLSPKSESNDASTFYIIVYLFFIVTVIVLIK